MGNRGPKPKSRAIRVFEGDAGHLMKSRHEGEVEPAKGSLPDPPEWLGEHGREKWAELVPALHAMDLLTLVDDGTFALYCEAWDDFHEALKSVREEGAVLMGAKGGSYINPAMNNKNTAAKRIMAIGLQFGLSPTSRVGLKAEPAAERDDFEEFKIGG